MSENLKIKIVDGNDEVELSTASKENIKAYMVKGEAGSSSQVDIVRSGSKVVLTTTDSRGTNSVEINDGVSPTVVTSREDKTTTVTIEDINGIRKTEIYDGIDLTGGVPTDGVIGWDNDDIFYTCDGTEDGSYYLTYENVNYYFTMPTVEDGDILFFNTTDLELSLNGTIIATSSSGVGTVLTFIKYIPNGYEETNELQEKLVSGTNIKTINNNSLLGSGNIDIGGSIINEESESTTDAYSCDYVNQVAQDLEDAINDKQEKGILLWTNPNPSSAFSEQTINNINLTDYEKIKIVFSRFTGNIQLTQDFIFDNSDLDCEIIYSDYDSGNVRSWNRSVILKTTSVEFGNCTINGTRTNTGLIPYKIIGYK